MTRFNTFTSVCFGNASYPISASNTGKGCYTYATIFWVRFWIISTEVESRWAG
ncbi:hypothetical protein Gotur_018911 [Gossypium turneri]